MTDPKALAELQSKVLEMMAANAYDHLPKVVKRRVKALKKIQVERLKMEVKFHEEMHALECKYAQMYQPLYDKRTKIVSGDYEPNEEECDFPSDTEGDEEKLSEDVKDKVNLKKEDEEMDTDNQDIKGIPEFWLQVFRNCDIIAENLQEHDEEILAHLQDIKVIHRENPMVSLRSLVTSLVSHSDIYSHFSYFVCRVLPLNFTFLRMNSSLIVY